MGLIPELGRSPGEGDGDPLQYSCLGNPMERGAWRATVHRITENQRGLSYWTPCISLILMSVGFIRRGTYNHLERSFFQLPKTINTQVSDPFLQEGLSQARLAPSLPRDLGLGVTVSWRPFTLLAAAAKSLQSVRPHRRQPTRLPHPWDSPGKNTRVGCHFLLLGP